MANNILDLIGSTETAKLDKTYSEVFKKNPLEEEMNISSSGIIEKGKKPDVWAEKMDYTPEMDLYTNVLKDIENVRGETGFKDGLYTPYSSYEGGEKTIGFGHKIGVDPEIDKLYDFEKGLTKAQTEELFQRDLSSAYKRTWQHYFNEHGQTSWDNLSDKVKIALTDVSFQKGHPSKELMKAVADKNEKKVIRLFKKRGYPGRDKIIDKYIKGDTYFTKKEDSMKGIVNAWKKEDNIF